MESCGKTTDFSEIQGEEVEEEGSIRFSCKGNQFPFDIIARLLEDILNVGGFTAKSWSIIDNLTVYFLRGIIYSL